MKANSFHKNQGFTLIESLLTVAIVGILAALAAPNFSAWLSNKKVDDITVQLEGALKEAQAQAVKTGQTCILNFDSAALKVTTPNPSCLMGGSLNLSKLDGSALSNNDSNVSLATANLGSPAQISFTFRGLALISTSGTGIITIYQNTSSSSRKSRCIAISSGIGIIRTGNYAGPNPNAPLETACATSLP
jgi:prepilin-type N-terminal cleavage/methylation domain-containing protein